MTETCPCHGEPWLVRARSGGGVLRQCRVKQREAKARYWHKPLGGRFRQAVRRRGAANERDLKLIEELRGRVDSWLAS